MAGANWGGVALRRVGMGGGGVGRAMRVRGQGWGATMKITPAVTTSEPSPAVWYNLSQSWRALWIAVVLGLCEGANHPRTG